MNIRAKWGWRLCKLCSANNWKVACDLDLGHMRHIILSWWSLISMIIVRWLWKLKNFDRSLLPWTHRQGSERDTSSCYVRYCVTQVCALWYDNREKDYALKTIFSTNFPVDISLWPCHWTYIFDLYSRHIHWLCCTPPPSDMKIERRMCIVCSTDL